MRLLNQLMVLMMMMMDGWTTTAEFDQDVEQVLGQGSIYHYLHFTGEETEIQRRQETGGK